VTPQASSTQDLARKSSEIPSVWVAETQTAGRGRQGHTWTSDRPLGLWCSVLLEPNEQQLPRLSLLGSLAAADAVRALTQLEPSLKWPNDLLWQNQKLAGLLVETIARPGRLPLAILGLGLNLAHQTADFPRELKKSAVSLRQASGRNVPRTQALAAFLDALAHRWTQPPDEILADFRAAWCQQGRTLQVRSGGREFAGTAEQVDDSGHLHLRLSDGSTKVFASGEADFPA
jgi:BirA family biotin operon repressor/biotin-[acetyl-CoA-carboxylase] ligase